MPLECSICTEVLLNGQKVAATQCGHVYHDKCLRDWVAKNNNRGICPVCRKDFRTNEIISLHSLDDNEAKATDAIFNFVKNVERKDVETRSLMEHVVDKLLKLTNDVADLKNQNAEMMSKMSSGRTSSESNNQNKEKDAQIVALKKEVQDLKAQRTEAAKQMAKIQQQIVALKKCNANNNDENKEPLRNATNQDYQEQQPISLSLKFDDIADRMILGDF